MRPAFVGHSGVSAPALTGRWAFHLLNAVSGALDIFGQPLSANELIRAAQRHTGLTDFGDWAIEGPLDVLIKSYEEEASLNAFGRIAARWDMLRFLSNLLKFHDEEERHPTILDQKIERPIFITGMPRSGTSFLHELLCEDHSNRAIRCWETIYPFPINDDAPDDSDRRRKKVNRQLAAFKWIAPEIRSLHPIDADTPQECTEITGHIFRGMRFDTTHYIPSYRRWLDSQSQIAAYRFHKRFLQHLQYRRGAARWVLKCPDHVFALDALRVVYPDARFVFMHRNPLSMLPSLARLTETLRHPFTSRLDRLQIGADLSRQWARGAAILVDAAKFLQESTDPPLHLTFNQFVRDPAECVETVYRHFGIDLDVGSAARVRRLMTEKPNGSNGRNRGRLEDYGLDAENERRRFGDYIAVFGVDT